MNVKSEKGSITLIALISVVFLLTFLISTYLLLASKAQTQLDITKKTIDIYDDADEVKERYNSYIGKNIIPIYNKEQLLVAGTGNTLNVNDKYYIFSSTNNTTYILMNNLTLTEGDNWIPIGEKENFNANFEGNRVQNSSSIFRFR